MTAIRAAFTAQAAACASLGSPFMAQLMRLCATQDWPAGAVSTRIHDWTGDLGPSGTRPGRCHDPRSRAERA
jgi:hypothetical protein